MNYPNSTTPNSTKFTEKKSKEKFRTFYYTYQVKFDNESKLSL